MGNVPAVLNGPIEIGVLERFTLLRLGAPGSLASCWLPLTHEPFVKMWSDVAAGATFILAPLATFTHGCSKVYAPVFTVPFAQLIPPPPPLPLLLGVLVAVLPPPPPL